MQSNFLHEQKKNIQMNNISYYSTEQSNCGSSGYYSSNMCSGSSIEEHIYNEPMIDIPKVQSINFSFTSTELLTESEVAKTKRVNVDNSSRVLKLPPMFKLKSGKTVNIYKNKNINKDYFYMTNRSLNESFVDSTNRFLKNSSFRCSKYSNQVISEAGCEQNSEPLFEKPPNRNIETNILNSKCQKQFENDVFDGSEIIQDNFSCENLNNFGKKDTYENNSFKDHNHKFETIDQSEEYIQDFRINQCVKSLETSIKNLNLHLKNYSNAKYYSMCSKPLKYLFFQCDNQKINDNDNIASTESEGLQNVHHRFKNTYMPTIMEGNDSQSSRTNMIQKKSWTDELLEDSLLDIDLDSFLLVNENLETTNSSSYPLDPNDKIFNSGFNNSSFVSNKFIDFEEIENNYKCSKYVNSCPENTSIIGSEVEHDFISNKGTDFLSVDKHEENVCRKYEDQIHFQQTRDMLNDIQMKIRNIADIAGEDDRVIPKIIENNINLLKSQLEKYIEIMNNYNELEIKQFCNGVVKNQKLVTLTKAFERRRTCAPDCFNCKIECQSLKNDLSSSQYDILSSNSSLMVGNNNHLIYDGGSSIEPNKYLNLSMNYNINFNTDDNRKISLNDKLNYNDLYRLENGEFYNNSSIISATTQMQKNLSHCSPFLKKENLKEKLENRVSILEWHSNKPSSWELYYGTNRLQSSVNELSSKHSQAMMSYPSSRPESDFTLDLPRAEQLRLKMDKEKKFRHRCRILTTFLSLLFFLLTVMVVSLVLTRGRRMFGSML